MKRLLPLLILFVSLSLAASPMLETRSSAVDTVVFTDSIGRRVEIPSQVEKVAPSGAVATMFLSCVAPEAMTNVNVAMDEGMKHYLPKELQSLPATGQLVGGKSTINYEELISTGAQVLIDIGDYKKGLEDDLDALSAQIGIPCIFIEGSLGAMASAFRTLGHLLGRDDRGEELALFVEETLAMAEANSASIKDEERVRVMFSSTPDGLGTNAKGSSQAQVIELVGAENAIVLEKVVSKGGGNPINLETLYKADPDVMVFNQGTFYGEVYSSPEWQELSAVKNGRCHEIPGEPYCWLGNPPSLNMVMGVWWLGNLLYPKYYDYDMKEVTKRMYKVFWDYSLSDAEVEDLLKNSTLGAR